MHTDRERFLDTMAYAPVDRPPLWEEGIREEVWEVWRKQRGPAPETFYTRHLFDRYSMPEVNLRPIPDFHPDERPESFLRLRAHYRKDACERFPKDWARWIRQGSPPDEPLGMTITRGVFQSLGVGDWSSLQRLLLAMADEPAVIEEATAGATELSLWALEHVLNDVTLDFAILSEPIASFHAPVISPSYYRRFAMPHLTRLIDRLRAGGVPVVMIQVYGNVQPLIPLWLEAGVNALRCAHARQAGMDYVALRRRYGKTLRLIGGIDATMLLKDNAAIDEELRRLVPPLLEDGGFLPMLDDRVRPTVPYARYCYYRTQLERLAAGT